LLLFLVTVFTATVLYGSGMGARHLSSGARAYTHAVGSIFDVNYTDMVKQLYIVGAPWAFHAAWKASQSFLSKDTRDKVLLSVV
jgi:CRAL/TRIO domain